MLKSLLKTIIPKDIWQKLVIAKSKIKSGLTFNYSLLESFDVWMPNSSYWFLYPSLTAKNANLYPQLLFQLQKHISSKNSQKQEIEILNSKNFGKLNANLYDSLSSLFRKYGSDKSTTHDYDRIYADFLHELGPDQPLKILEIGIGTNRPNLVSTRPITYIPGASLRAFRDALPRSDIYGADIDEEILFTEQRIKTAWVDQFDPNSYIKMTDALDEYEFDLIIDDGLHAVSANLSSLLFALSHLRQNGVYITEDIPKRSVNAWLPIIGILREQYACSMIKCQNEYLFFLRMENSAAS